MTYISVRMVVRIRRIGVLKESEDSTKTETTAKVKRKSQTCVPKSRRRLKNMVCPRWDSSSRPRGIQLNARIYAQKTVNVRKIKNV